MRSAESRYRTPLLTRSRVTYNATYLSLPFPHFRRHCQVESTLRTEGTSCHLAVHSTLQRFHAFQGKWPPSFWTAGKRLAKRSSLALDRRTDYRVIRQAENRHFSFSLYAHPTKARKLGLCSLSVQFMS